MRIAFLTTCLEPGCDGVGDYTAALATECVRRGHPSTALSLNDSFIEGVKGDACTLRLGPAMSWSDRVARAREHLDRFAPDFVSVQFVCYGFEPRGLCWRAADGLRAIIGERPVHMMFHETWIGAERGASGKARLIGWLQRMCVQRVLRALDVRRVHTSNPAYAALLGKSGVPATVLPLFGSVPPSARASRMERASPWRFLMFGTLHPVWPPEPLFTHIRALGVAAEIVHAGRIGAGAALWDRMQRDYSGAFEFRQFGKLSPEMLADAFAESDFGIATTPWEIIGKSASVAAMIEHGLPVIVNRDDVHYLDWREEGYSPQLIKMDDDLPDRLAAARRQPQHDLRTEVAARFLADLEAAG